MSRIDRNVLRLGSLRAEDTGRTSRRRSTINEAVELGKTFGTRSRRRLRQRAAGPGRGGARQAVSADDNPESAWRRWRRWPGWTRCACSWPRTSGRCGAPPGYVDWRLLRAASRACWARKFFKGAVGEKLLCSHRRVGCARSRGSWSRGRRDRAADQSGPRRRTALSQAAAMLNPCEGRGQWRWSFPGAASSTAPARAAASTTAFHAGV